MDYMINTYDMKIFTPMTFYNLDKQPVVEYQSNIAASFNNIQRFDLDIPEIPNLTLNCMLTYTTMSGNQLKIDCSSFPIIKYT